MQQDKKWGTIEQGKEANMIMLAANPLGELEAITNVEAVFPDNHMYSKDELRKQLDQPDT